MATKRTKFPVVGEPVDISRAVQLCLTLVIYLYHVAHRGGSNENRKIVIVIFGNYCWLLFPCCMGWGTQYRSFLEKNSLRLNLIRMLTRTGRRDAIALPK